MQSESVSKSVMSSSGRGTTTNPVTSSLIASGGGMQPGGQQHTMGTPGTPQQNQGPQAQGQSDPNAMLSPAGTQPMQFAGQPMVMPTGAILPQPQPQFQYVMTVNQQGQQVLTQVPTLSYPAGMTTMPAQGTQQGQQYIITGNTSLLASKGGQQPQMISGSPQAIQGKAMSQSGPASSMAPTYTFTSNGLVASGGTSGPQAFIMAHNMTGSPTMQAATPAGMIPSASGGHIKAEPGKQPSLQLQASNQTSNTSGQAQQMTPHGQMILPPGMFATQTTPGQAQAYIQNGQIILRHSGPQDGQATSQLMYSSQGLQIQPHPQALQPNLNQPMPAGLTTSMQPMSVVSTTSMSRPSYTTQPPTGKTQISRAPPTLLPATSTTTNTTARTSTSSSASMMTQPSPKSKQKVSPRNSGPLSKTPLSSTTPKSILNNLKSAASSVPPPVLTSNGAPLGVLGAPGSPSSGGPPILQTSSLAAPLPPSSGGPPVLHPMNMMPAGAPFMNKPSPLTSSMGGSAQKPSDGPTSTLASTAGKIPIRPALTKPSSGSNATTAAPMEPVGGLNKSVTEVNGKHDVSKPPNECLTHVIDGHVIQESSQPFPLDDDSKGTYNYMVIAMYTSILSYSVHLVYCIKSLSTT